jgi:hypothetical protein
MTTKSLALVGSRFREQKELHIAEWAAQLVCGYRALRRLVDAGSIGTLRRCRATGHPRLSYDPTVRR